MAEKTEKATPKKLRDARKKGQVARAQDFPSAITFVTAIAATLFSTSYLYRVIGSYIIGTFRSVKDHIEMETQGGALIMEAIRIIGLASFPIMIAVCFVGVITSFLVVGPVFSFQAMKFNFKKLYFY